jgi:uncharacterized membrane protein YfcA
MSFEYWFVFPVAVLVATIAMASGIGGATFFSPFFLLALGLAPEVAIGTGLITEVFGFASGVTAYLRRRLIDFRLARSLLLGAVPLAILGAWLAPRAEPDLLKTILGMGLLAVGFSFLRAPDRGDVERLDKAIEEAAGQRWTTCLVDRGGRRFCYTVHENGVGGFFAAVGGLFEGLISTGLGELNGYFLLQRCKVPSPVAVATSVFVVAITAVSAAGGHLFRFVRTGGEVLDTVLSIVVFTIPGVILGAQIGARIASRIPQRTLERGLGILFGLIAAITLIEAAL